VSALRTAGAIAAAAAASGAIARFSYVPGVRSCGGKIVFETSARDERLRVLGDFWATWEISGVALLDIALWHWMYEHPDATPAQLREATVSLARDLWNRHYAPVLGEKDSALLGIYSHIIAPSFLYLPAFIVPLTILLHILSLQQLARMGRPASA